jgi:hypothetical protein
VDPSVSELASRGGWIIEDPRRRRHAYPETFSLPDSARREQIQAGSQVCVLLWFVDETAAGELVPQCERMWALVESRGSDVLSGRLTSPPVSARAPLAMGQSIEFRPIDAVDVLDPEEGWRDHLDFLSAIFEGDEAFERYQQSQLDPEA